MLFSEQSQYLSNIYFCSLYFWAFSCGVHHHTQSSFTRCLSVPHRSQQIEASWRHAWCIASLSATDKIVIICVQTDFVTCRKSRWHWLVRALPTSRSSCLHCQCTCTYTDNTTSVSHLSWGQWIPDCVSSTVTKLIRQWTLADELATFGDPSNFLS